MKKTLMSMKGIFFLISLSTNLFVFGQCMSGDCENGFGVYKYTGMDVYRGNWANGQRSGYGDHYYNNGDVYKGHFEANKFNGSGKYYFSNGDIKDCIWENGSEIKLIVYQWGTQKAGGCVSGNCQNGFGKYIYTNGTYEGNFTNGQWRGKGKKTFPNGDIYEGEYNGFKSNGYGVLTWAKGEKYEGNFVDGKAEGQGTFYYLDGTRYTGNLSNFSRSGYGVYYYLDGSVYSGNWTNGQKNGQGNLEYPSGKVENGTFENNKFLGTSTQKQINSAVQNSTNNTIVKSETPVENCTHKFVKPTNLTYKYIDNRQSCCYCRKSYASYSVKTNLVNIEQTTFIAEKLYMHLQETNASEEHRKNDLEKMTKFINSNYTGSEDFMLGIGAGVSMMAFPMYRLSGIKLGSNVREIDKYKLNGKFCSPKCRDNCEYSSSCNCR